VAGPHTRCLFTPPLLCFTYCLLSSTRSGNYSVTPTVWTAAHVTQFTSPGWHYLAGEGYGLLPGGGSWTAMVPPQVKTSAKEPQRVAFGSRGVAEARSGDLTLIIEKLEGACLRCRVAPTTTEPVVFALTGPIAGVTRLALWCSNATHQFVRLPDLVVADDTIRILAPRDTILTLSTTTGQRKGVAAEPILPTPLFHFLTTTRLTPVSCISLVATLPTTMAPLKSVPTTMARVTTLPRW